MGLICLAKDAMLSEMRNGMNSLMVIVGCEQTSSVTSSFGYLTAKQTLPIYTSFTQHYNHGRPLR